MYSRFLFHHPCCEDGYNRWISPRLLWICEHGVDVESTGPHDLQYAGVDFGPRRTECTGSHRQRKISSTFSIVSYTLSIVTVAVAVVVTLVVSLVAIIVVVVVTFVNAVTLPGHLHPDFQGPDAEG